MPMDYILTFQEGKNVVIYRKSLLFEYFSYVLFTSIIQLQYI